MSAESVRTLEVCVVAYRNTDTIGMLVDSLSLVPGVTLAVHDNGPGAETLALASRLAAAAGIPFRGEGCPAGNCGFGAGCNRLAATSHAVDLLFLNPDAWVKSWPAGLAARGRVVGALVQAPTGRPAYIWGTSRRLRDEMALRWLRRRPAAPTGSGYVSGAAMLVEREQFAALGGFDEAYFMYYEDIDLCRRAAAAGVPIVLDPSWVVVHEGGHSVGRSPDALTRAHLTSYASGRRFHGSQGHATAYDGLVLVDAFGRMLAFGLTAKRRADGVANRAVAATALRNLATRRPADG